MFMEQNPHVKVDFQWFAFGDLGKKISVGFATGTAPDGFVSQDWFMPVWLDKGLLAPLDVKKLGYDSYGAFTGDFAKAFVDGATKDGKVYGYPMWFYGYCNYLNAKQFKEVGLDAEKDWPQNWEQLGEVAKRMTIKDGDKFVRQGFKFAMHAAQWTMIQFNPILLAIRRKVVRRVREMHRQQRCRRQGDDDPRLDRAEVRRRRSRRLDRDQSDTGHGFPEGTDVNVLLPSAADQPRQGRKSRRWPTSNYFRPVQYPGVQTGKGFSTTYGFNLVINAKASAEKQEALHDLYKFMMSDLVDAWRDAAPFTFAKKTRMGRQSRSAEVSVRQ